MKRCRRFGPDRNFRNISAWLVVLALWLAVGYPAGAQPEALPARGWNQHNIAMIETNAREPLTFAVMGDNRDGDAIFARLLQQMQADPEIQFAIDIGDLVPRGELHHYQAFFELLKGAFTKPFLGVVGNHELYRDPEGQLFQAIFGPRSYAFRVKGHAFIMVDDCHKGGISEAQERWLAQELEKARDCATRLVFLHIPLFDPSPGKSHRALPEGQGQRLAALFKRHRVTHIFTGDIHAYYTGHWDGTPYTITGGAGAPMKFDDAQHYFFNYLKVTLVQGRVQIQVQRLATAP